MCVCVGGCEHACLYICVHVCVCAWVDMCVSMGTCVHVFVCIHPVYVNVSVHVRVYSVLFVQKKVGGRVCEHMHARAINNALSQGRTVQKGGSNPQPPSKSQPASIYLCM